MNSPTDTEPYLVKLPLSLVCRDCFEDMSDEQLGCGHGSSWHYHPGGDGWITRDHAARLASEGIL